jgi:hypothetical protein
MTSFPTAPNDNHTTDNDQNAHAVLSEMGDTIQRRSFSDWHGGSLQHLGGLLLRRDTPRSAEGAAPGLSSDHPISPTEDEEMVDLPATEHAHTFAPNPANAAASSGEAVNATERASVPQYFCQTCQTTVHKDNAHKHIASALHQRRTADCLVEEADEPARTTVPRHFCELCQTSFRQDYLRQHEATRKHQTRMAERDPTHEPPAPTTRTYKKAPAWTPEEDEVIMRAWVVALKEADDIVELFPDRSRSAVKERRIYLTNPRPTANGGMEISEEYRRILGENNGLQRNKRAL